MSRIVAFIVHELREAFVPFLFFAVLFGLGRVTKALTLEEYHVTPGGTAVAIIGALIVAKAILVAEALPVTRRFAGRPLVYAILWKVAIYWLITAAFRYLEELLPLARKYGLAQGHERLLEEVSWPHFWAVQIWVVFALVLYCTMAELVRAIGVERVKALLFGGRSPVR